MSVITRSPGNSLLIGVWRLVGYLSKARRWQLAGLFVIMFAGAAAELATLGAVLPFLALLANPSLSSNYPRLEALFEMAGWGAGQGILLPATMFFALVAVCAAAVRVLLTWVSLRFTYGVGVDLGVEVYRRTLFQPYSFHVSRNTSEIIAALNKVQIVVSGVLNPLIQGVVALVLSLAILGALISIDQVTAITAGFGFAGIYFLITLSTRRQLRRNGKVIGYNETARIKAVQEGLGGIRDVLIDGTQSVYINRYWALEASQRRAQAANSLIGATPRYLIEAFGMVLISAIAYWLSTQPGGLSAAIPVLGALAIGAQKLIPQMQQVYNSWATFSGNHSILFDVFELLDQPIPAEYLPSGAVEQTHLQQGIVLNRLSFQYRPDAPKVIREITLQIPRGSRVGFVGVTGCGKSTVIDLIMGLLDPTSGQIEIDGQALTGVNRRAWQACIAHVPQSIYLADTTIAENIAFGVNAHLIDHDRVLDAARKAQLAEFIETLPATYQTHVGERGVRLSGGQRQRIGLARALYKKASVLILDEATSALDDGTERAVMQAVDSLGKDVTVLMIAHRVSTLQACDLIFELKSGRLIRTGSYQQLFGPEKVATKVNQIV